MNSQLKATRFAMSKSLEGSENVKNSRNNSSVLVIEDRLAGDFSDKFGSRDRTPVVASGNASFSSQMFQPLDDADYGDQEMLPHYDVWINGQQFSFLTANFKTVNLPTAQGSLKACDEAHPQDTRCWDPACLAGLGCVVLQKQVQNYPGSGFNPGNSFDINFNKTDPVPAALKQAVNGTDMKFMWQWQGVPAIKGMATADNLDVDGDFYVEQILKVMGTDAAGHITSIEVIDHQDGDIDFSLDGRKPNVKAGLLDDAQMYSITRSGTTYRIQEGKLFYANPGGQFVRNTNRNDHVDFAQRIFKLSNNTGRFCNGDTPLLPAQVEACNNCFSAINVQKTCMDVQSLQIFVRSRIHNEGGRSWFTQTEPGS